MNSYLINVDFAKPIFAISIKTQFPSNSLEIQWYQEAS